MSGFPATVTFGGRGCRADRLSGMFNRKTLIAALCLEIAAFWIADRIRRPVLRPGRVELPYLVSIGSFTVSPSTVSIASTDPDTGGNGSATVTSVINGPIGGKPWSVTVNTSGSTNLTNCATVPVSAVRATCSLAISGTGGTQPTGACGSAFNLSTTDTTIASGTQGDGSGNTYTITMSYHFTDAWNYLGASSPACTVTLAYTLHVGL